MSAKKTESKPQDLEALVPEGFERVDGELRAIDPHQAALSESTPAVD